MDEASTWIAIGAFAVSLLALGLSLYELLSNKPKLRVVMSSAATSPDYEGVRFSGTPRKLRQDEIGADAIEMVAIDITNYGRQPTMIKTIEFQMPHGKKSVGPTPASPGKDRGASLPVEIAPGQFRTFYFDAAVLVVFDRGTDPIPLRDFVFLRDVELAIRHSWRKNPMIIRGIQSK